MDVLRGILHYFSPILKRAQPILMGAQPYSCDSREGAYVSHPLPLDPPLCVTTPVVLCHKTVHTVIFGISEFNWFTSRDLFVYLRRRLLHFTSLFAFSSVMVSPAKSSMSSAVSFMTYVVSHDVPSVVWRLMLSWRKVVLFGCIFGFLATFVWIRAHSCSFLDTVRGVQEVVRINRASRIQLYIRFHWFNKLLS